MSLKDQNAVKQNQEKCVTRLVVAGFLVLVGLERILSLVAHEGSRDSAHESMSAHFVAAKVSRGAASKRTQETTVALRLCIRVGMTVLLALWRAAVLLAVRILLLGVSTLLRELLGWCLARVLLLSVLSACVSSCFETRRLRHDRTTTEHRGRRVIFPFQLKKIR
jgi:hypothetical protein